MANREAEELFTEGLFRLAYQRVLELENTAPLNPLVMKLKDMVENELADENKAERIRELLKEAGSLKLKNKY